MRTYYGAAQVPTYRVVYQHDLTSEVQAVTLRAFYPYELLHRFIWRINTRSTARGWVVVLNEAGEVVEGWPRQRWRLYYDPRDVPQPAGRVAGC